MSWLSPSRLISALCVLLVFLAGCKKQSVEVEVKPEPHPDRAALLRDIAVIEDTLSRVRSSTLDDDIAVLRAALEPIKEFSKNPDLDYYGSTLKVEVEELFKEAAELQSVVGEQKSGNAVDELSLSQLRDAWLRDTELRFVEDADSARDEFAAELKASSGPTFAQLRERTVELEQQRQLQQTQEQRTQLELEFSRDLPEIQRVLRGFLSPGTKYTTEERSHIAGTAAPVSYAFLVRNRYLRETANDVHRFLEIGSRNGRPSGSLPRPNGGLQNNSPSEVKAAYRAHELMRKYGELMVEKGLLSP